MSTANLQDAAEALNKIDYTKLDPSKAPDALRKFIEEQTPKLEEEVKDLAESLKDNMHARVATYADAFKGGVDVKDPLKTLGKLSDAEKRQEAIQDISKQIQYERARINNRTESVKNKFDVHVLSVLQNLRNVFERGNLAEKAGALLSLADDLIEGMDDFSHSVALDHPEFAPVDGIWRLAELGALSTVYGIARAGIKAASLAGKTLTKVGKGTSPWKAFVQSFKEVCASICKKAIRIISGKDSAKAVNDFYLALGITSLAEKSEKEGEFKKIFANEKALKLMVKAVGKLSPEVAEDLGETIKKYSDSDSDEDKAKLQEILEIAKEAPKSKNPEITMIVSLSSIEAGIDQEQRKNIVDIMQDEKIAKSLEGLPPQTIAYLADNVVNLKSIKEPDALRERIIKAIEVLAPIKKEQNALEESIANMAKDKADKKEASVEVSITQPSKSKFDSTQKTQKRFRLRSKTRKYKVSEKRISSQIRQIAINKKAMQLLEKEFRVKRLHGTNIARTSGV